MNYYAYKVYYDGTETYYGWRDSYAVLYSLLMEELNNDNNIEYFRVTEGTSEDTAQYYSRVEREIEETTTTTTTAEPTTTTTTTTTSAPTKLYSYTIYYVDGTEYTHTYDPIYYPNVTLEWIEIEISNQGYVANDNILKIVINYGDEYVKTIICRGSEINTSTSAPTPTVTPTITTTTAPTTSTTSAPTTSTTSAPTSTTVASTTVASTTVASTTGMPSTSGIPSIVSLDIKFDFRHMNYGTESLFFWDSNGPTELIGLTGDDITSVNYIIGVSGRKYIPGINCTVNIYIDPPAILAKGEVTGDLGGVDDIVIVNMSSAKFTAPEQNISIVHDTISDKYYKFRAKELVMSYDNIIYKDDKPYFRIRVGNDKYCYVAASGIVMPTPTPTPMPTPAPQPNNEIYYTASVKLPETTTEWSSGLHTNAFSTPISSHTFENGQGKIVFAGNVTNIENHAFYGCTDLKSVTLPNSVTYIGDEAFKNCDYMASINIPNSVTYIGYQAFFDCISLTSITLPNSITNLENCLFSVSEPGSLSTVTFDGTTTEFLNIAPQDDDHDGLFYGQPVVYIECSNGNIDASPYKQSEC